MWSVLSSLPSAVTKYNVIPFLRVKDLGILDSAVLVKSARVQLGEWMRELRSNETLEIRSSSWTPHMLIWLTDNEITVSRVVISITLYYTDEVYDWLVWLITLSDETEIRMLFASHQQLCTIFTAEEVMSKLVATCNVYGDDSTAELARLIATHCTNIRHLTFTPESATQHTVVTCNTFQRWSQLETLEVQEGHDFGEDAVILWTTVPRCASLKRLESVFMVDMYMIPIAQSCAMLEEILLAEADSASVQFSEASVLAIAAHCPRLRVLDVSGSTVATDAAVVALCRNCPLLSTLYMGRNAPVTYHVALRAIQMHGRNLQRLAAPIRLFLPHPSSPSPLPEQDAELATEAMEEAEPEEDIQLQLPPQPQAAHQQHQEPGEGAAEGHQPEEPWELHTQPNLQQLLIRPGNTRLHQMDAAALSTAAQAACLFAANVTDMRCLLTSLPAVAVMRAIPQCPAPMRLECLTCENAPDLTDAIVCDAVAVLPQLHELALRGAENLTDATLFAAATHCRHLRSANFNYSPRMTDAGWIPLLQACRGLTHINAHCAGVSDAFCGAVRATSAKIEQLDISGCGRITPSAIVQLAVECTHLQRLTAWDQGMTEEESDRLLMVERTRKFEFIREFRR